MHIMHIVESYGGGVVSVLNQIINDQAQNHRVTLIYSKRTETPAELGLHPSVTAIHLQMPSKPNLSTFKIASALADKLIELKPDILHLHSSMAGALGRLAARKARFNMRRVIYSPHGFSFLRLDQSALMRKAYWLAEKGLAGLGGTVLGCSNDEFLLAQKLTTRVGLVRNAVDTEAISALISGEVKREQPFTVVTVGRVCPQKSPEDVKATAKLVQQIDPSIRFVWIGGEGDGDPLDPIHYIPWATRSEVLHELATGADVFFLASLWEGLPMVLLEAMAIGLPCVARDIIGNRDAVEDGFTGILAKDTSEMADAILRLSRDPALVERMGSAGQRRIRGYFNRPRMAAELAAVYLALHTRSPTFPRSHFMR